MVPGGGLNADGSRWLPSRAEFLVPAQALSIIFRAPVPRYPAARGPAPCSRRSWRRNLRTPRWPRTSSRPTSRPAARARRFRIWRRRPPPIRATCCSLKVAALQAWFGQEKELAATRQRILAFAKDTNDAGTAERAAKACSIRASTNKAELDAALALARKGVELGKGGEWWEWRLLALGMAEYRSGNHAAAIEALLAAAKAGSNNPIVTGISAFYRAMSLSRQGKSDEARKLAIAAAAQMKPLPKDEQNPPAGDAYWDDLILWLAYKEAKAMIHFDAPPRRARDTRREMTADGVSLCGTIPSAGS